MPAPKAPEHTKSQLLQVRVTPGIKKKVDLFLKKREKITGTNYGYPEFLRDAIDLYLDIVDPNPKILSNTGKELSQLAFNKYRKHFDEINKRLADIESKMK